MLANPDIVPSTSINHWILSILMFHFTLVHIPGTHHGSDRLSRQCPQPGDKPEPKDDFEDWIDNVNGFMHIINSIIPHTNKNWWLETLQWPDRMLDPEYKMFMWYCTEFFVSSRKLWCKDSKGQHKMVIAKE